MYLFKKQTPIIKPALNLSWKLKSKKGKIYLNYKNLVIKRTKLTKLSTELINCGPLFNYVTLKISRYASIEKKYALTLKEVLKLGFKYYKVKRYRTLARFYKSLIILPRNQQLDIFLKKSDTQYYHHQFYYYEIYKKNRKLFFTGRRFFNKKHKNRKTVKKTQTRYNVNKKELTNNPFQSKNKGKVFLKHKQYTSLKKNFFNKSRTSFHKKKNITKKHYISNISTTSEKKVTKKMK